MIAILHDLMFACGAAINICTHIRPAVNILIKEEGNVRSGVVILAARMKTF